MSVSRRLWAALNDAGRPWIGWAVTALGVFVLTYGCLEFARAGGRIAIIWAANAFFLVALLNAGPKRVVGITVSAVAGLVAGNLAVGNPPVLVAGLPLAHVAEVLICYFGLRAFGDLDVTRPRTLGTFALIAVGPASVASGLVTAAVFQTAGSDNVGGAFLVWYAAHALGLITFTPLFTSIARRAAAARPSRDGLLQALAAAIGFSVLLAGIFLQSSYPVLFLVYPALVLIAFRHGFFGASVALVMTALVALVATAEGYGPLSLVHGSMREQVIILQIFVAVSAIMSLAIAAVLAERDRLTADLRAAKETAEAAERLLSESERRYRLLAQHTSDVIILLSLGRGTEYVSPSIRSLLGYAPDDFATLAIPSLVHPDDGPRLAALVRSLGPQRRRATDVHRMLRADGGYVWVEAAFTFFEDGAADSARIMAVVRDVSERQAYARQLETAREAAEEALKVKSEFLAMMSHELRTPLNGIIGFSDLIIDSGELRSAEGRRYAANVRNASRALLSVVNDVMDVSKLEAGALELDPHPFSIRDLLEGTVGIVRPEADKKDLMLEVAVDESVPDILVGDDARLRQVLLNLLSNAVKFTPAGLVSLSARAIASTPQSATLRIAVRDTGIGVPADKRHRLFKRFSQVDQTTSRRYGGAGLGLSICKSLVELMGGRISAVSEEGVGSEFAFEVTFSVAQAERAAAPAAVLMQAAQPASLKVLVAEDTPLNQELLAALLARWGCSVDLVKNGVEAVEAARRERYAGVLMDVQMPHMDGVDAAIGIRALAGPASEVPIVALTANVMPDQIARFEAAGMNGHLGKPFVPEDLKAVIDGWRMIADDASSRPLDFDQRALEELRSLVGEAALGSFLIRLERQMTSAFAAAPASEADLASLRYEAHALASTAGMLGFAKLSSTCVALENAIDQGGASLASVLGPLADALAARDQAQFTIEGLIESHEPARAAG